MRHLLPRAVLLLALLTALGGCDTKKTFRLTFEMPPENVGSIQVTGSGPFVVVANDGPDDVMITFDADSPAQDGPRLVRPNTATGSTLAGSNVVRLETGPGSGAIVRVEASKVGTLNLDPPRPTGQPEPTP